MSYSENHNLLANDFVRVWMGSGLAEQPTRLRILGSVSLPAVNCSIRTASISGPRGGNELWGAQKYKPRLPDAQKGAAVGATWVASKLAGLNMRKWLQPRKDPLD